MSGTRTAAAIRIRPDATLTRVMLHAPYEAALVEAVGVPNMRLANLVVNGSDSLDLLLWHPDAHRLGEPYNWLAATVAGERVHGTAWYVRRRDDPASPPDDLQDPTDTLVVYLQALHGLQRSKQ